MFIDNYKDEIKELVKNTDNEDIFDKELDLIANRHKAKNKISSRVFNTIFMLETEIFLNNNVLENQKIDNELKERLLIENAINNNLLNISIELFNDEQKEIKKYLELKKDTYYKEKENKYLMVKYDELKAIKYLLFFILFSIIFMGVLLCNI